MRSSQRKSFRYDLDLKNKNCNKFDNLEYKIMFYLERNVWACKNSFSLEVKLCHEVSLKISSDPYYSYQFIFLVGMISPNKISGKIKSVSAFCFSNNYPYQSQDLHLIS